jgi:hypothetical protein
MPADPPGVVIHSAFPLAPATSALDALRKSLALTELNLSSHALHDPAGKYTDVVGFWPTASAAATSPIPPRSRPPSSSRFPRRCIRR